MTTTQQFLTLLEEIKKCPQIAKGYPIFRSNKFLSYEKWEQISAKLNSMGPPTRTPSEWKKVWCDLKMRAKRRLEDHPPESRSCWEDTLNETSFIDREVNKILGLSDQFCRSIQESFEKPDKRLEEDTIDDEALTEFQFVNAPSPESSTLIEPCTTIAKTDKLSVSTAAATAASTAAISAAVFEAVSAAASAAANTIASTAALTDVSASTSTAKTDGSSPKRRKTHDDELLKLLRQQVAYQHDICKSMRRVANAVELYVGNSTNKQVVEEDTELSDMM